MLGLFHPQILVLRPAQRSSLLISLDDGRDLTLRVGESATVRRQGSALELEFGGVTTRRLTSAWANAVPQGSNQLDLEVPAKLQRTYHGSVRLSVAAEALLPVVVMATETAVASIVQAESPPGAPLEALKAQAVATRSFLLAKRTGHVQFDACDTTHCQFLRSPPDADSRAALSAAATRGLVLEWQGEPTDAPQLVAAMYSRSCGGTTRTLAQAGLPAQGKYPFYAVHCTFCMRHPERGIGHAVGMCQLGAASMAAQGKTFAEILAHFYPNTQLTQLKD